MCTSILQEEIYAVLVGDISVRFIYMCTRILQEIMYSVLVGDIICKVHLYVYQYPTGLDLLRPCRRYYLLGSSICVLGSYRKRSTPSLSEILSVRFIYMCTIGSYRKRSTPSLSEILSVRFIYMCTRILQLKVLKVNHV